MIKLKSLLSESTLGSNYPGDAGEKETGNLRGGKIRRLGSKAGKPEPWFEGGGYEQLDFPKADFIYGKAAPEDMVVRKKVIRAIEPVTKFNENLREGIVTPSEFDKVIKQAKKETGKNDKIPSKTKSMCADVMKYGIHKLDYKGKPSKARQPKKLMYQYYAYIQGWGHGQFQGPSDWFLKGVKFDPILEWIYENHYNSIFSYDYLLKHVTSDLQTVQIISDISPGERGVEPAYYLVKSYYNAFGSSRGTYTHDQVVNKVDWWLKKNKVETR